MEVLATDAPPEFSTLREATLSILRVDAIGPVDTGSSATRTVTLFSAPVGQEQDVDLLPLKGGQNELIAGAPVPAGTYNRIRLFIDAGQVIIQPTDQPPTTYNTENGNLTLAGGVEQQGVRIYDIDLPGEGVTVDNGEVARVLLDFDLQQSLDATGDPATAVTFTPIVRARSISDPATLSNVRGVVRSNQGTATTADDVPLPGAFVTVTDANADVVATTNTDSTGVYVLEGIEPGSYVLTVSNTGFTTQQIDIETQAGQSLTSDVLLVQTQAN